jgi:hypothetical protein
VIILGQPVTILQIACGLVALGAISVVAARHRQPAESLLE